MQYNIPCQLPHGSSSDVLQHGQLARHLINICLLHAFVYCMRVCKMYIKQPTAITADQE